jgi:hypothetical protein
MMNEIMRTKKIIDLSYRFDVLNLWFKANLFLFSLFLKWMRQIQIFIGFTTRDKQCPKNQKNIWRMIVVQSHLNVNRDND